jgi:hypothetical protein
MGNNWETYVMKSFIIRNVLRVLLRRLGRMELDERDM